VEFKAQQFSLTQLENFTSMSLFLRETADSKIENLGIALWKPQRHLPKAVKPRRSANVWSR